ncbi:DNA-binding protein [Micromonospora sp. 4G57]|uniref:DNA-binding protein n=1 Tax=Micromonospora sicca TaxID=2202420 RepID=A0ABU5JPV0_9ACTN|nr:MULTISPECIES: DNA-binding protein [unclassified Micromonospora]MDZ5447915.1 DNA-binding protein [Micromonospora sp. 4G57]MDZ5494665.1 DNA-binding protein [Micromonospora sp. 4G53]
MSTPDQHPTPATPTRPAGDGSHNTWTAQRIRALGTVTDLSTAAKIFGLSRSVAYDLAKRDRFPVPVLRFGSRYRVPVAAILTALHLPTAAGDPGSSAGPPDDDLTPGGSHASITPYRIRSPRLPHTCVPQLRVDIVGALG